MGASRFDELDSVIYVRRWSITEAGAWVWLLDQESGRTWRLEGTGWEEVTRP